MLDGLELDIWLPSLKLGIEWNGIYHYKPIRGDQALQRIQSADERKKIICKEKNIKLIVIEDMTSHKKFIAETIDIIIKEIGVMVT